MKKIKCKDRLEAVKLFIRPENAQKLSKEELLLGLEYICRVVDTRPKTKELLERTKVKINETRK